MQETITHKLSGAVAALFLVTALTACGGGGGDGAGDGGTGGDGAGGGTGGDGTGGDGTGGDGTGGDGTGGGAVTPVAIDLGNGAAFLQRAYKLEAALLALALDVENSDGACAVSGTVSPTTQGSTTTLLYSQCVSRVMGVTVKKNGSLDFTLSTGGDPGATNGEISVSGLTVSLGDSGQESGAISGTATVSVSTVPGQSVYSMSGGNISYTLDGKANSASDMSLQLTDVEGTGYDISGDFKLNAPDLGGQVTISNSATAKLSGVLIADFPKQGQLMADGATQTGSALTPLGDGSVSIEVNGTTVQDSLPWQLFLFSSGGASGPGSGPGGNDAPPGS